MLADARLPNSLPIGVAGKESVATGHPVTVTGPELAR
jgi:hypothetical protein